MSSSNAPPLENSHRILVVDDDVAFAQLANLILLRAGYQIDLAAGGFAAIAKLKQNPYDLVITDYLMPDLNGFQLIDSMNNLGIEVPVILVSAGRTRISGNTVEVSVDGHDYSITTLRVVGAITRPYGPKELITAVESALSPAKPS